MFSVLFNTKHIGGNYMKAVFKRSLAALVTAASLVGCAGTSNQGGSGEAKTSLDYSYVYGVDLKSMDYLTTYRSEDHRYNANFIDGLLENDQYGNFVGSVAESYESNEDKTEWTFKIRKGVKWVTNEGDEYGEVTANDFVAGLQHAADFESGTAYLVEGVIKNFSEYEAGQVTFDQVGVKAVDDYTLVYTLEKPVSYFYSLTTYSILYPVNQKFLESKGAGCKLGAPNLDDCAFGSVDPTSILYNGAYILTNNTAKSVIELTKNENYWDADHVYANKLTFTYDDGSDDHSVINGFEAGNYTYAALNGSWSKDEFQKYLDKYKDNAYVAMPDSGTFNLAFNYNRSSYKNSSKTTDEEKANTHKAIMSKNFRFALMFAVDRVSYLTQVTGSDEVSKLMLRNTLTPSEFVQIDGKPYGEYVAKEVAATSNGVFDDSLNLADGQDPYYNPEKAKMYLEKAAKEDGVVLPVTLDMAVRGSSTLAVNSAASLKKSIEDSLGGQVLVNNVLLANDDDYYASTYLTNNGQESDWDISTASGWSPDYLDPRSYVNIYSPVNGDMLNSIGLNAETAENDYQPSDKTAATEVGLYDYQKLLTEADAITDDLNKRYEAYAKADAWLIANAFTLPIQCSRLSYVVSKVVPFERQYAETGLGEYKFKYLRVQDTPITVEQYNKAKADWEAKRATK